MVPYYVPIWVVMPFQSIRNCWSRITMFNYLPASLVALSTFPKPSKASIVMDSLSEPLTVPWHANQRLPSSSRSVQWTWTKIICICWIPLTLWSGGWTWTRLTRFVISWCGKAFMTLNSNHINLYCCIKAVIIAFQSQTRRIMSQKQQQPSTNLLMSLTFVWTFAFMASVPRQGWTRLFVHVTSTLLGIGVKSTNVTIFAFTRVIAAQPHWECPSVLVQRDFRVQDAKFKIWSSQTYWIIIKMVSWLVPSWTFVSSLSCWAFALPSSGTKRSSKRLHCLKWLKRGELVYFQLAARPKEKGKSIFSPNLPIFSPISPIFQ